MPSRIQKIYLKAGYLNLEKVMLNMLASKWKQYFSNVEKNQSQ